MIKKLPAWLSQAGKFALVGLLNTTIDFGIYFPLTRFIPFMGDHPSIAKGISFSIAVVNSYILNRQWTFKSKINPWITIGPFILVNLVGLLIHTGSVKLFLEILKWNELLVLAIAATATIIWNFFINKFLVFRK